MILVSLKLLIDSSASLINKTYFEFSWILILVCILTIITKLILYIYTKKLFKKYKEGDKKARKKIINHNLRLVINIAKKYVHRGMDYLDIIQNGNIF